MEQIPSKKDDKNYKILSPKEAPFNAPPKELPPEGPSRRNKFYIVTGAFCSLIIVAGVFYFSIRHFISSMNGSNKNAPAAEQQAVSAASSTSTGAAGATQPSESPNTAKFSEYFSQFDLEKLPVGREPSKTNIPVKTALFTSSEQLCTNAVVIKTVPKGSFASVIYDADAIKDVVPRRTSQYALTPGVIFGCRPLNLTAGRYEYKAYIDGVPVVVLPFEVK